MSIYSDLVKKSGTYSIGVIVSRIGSVFLLPLYSRYLTPADYGVMAIIDLAINVFTAILGLQVSEALFYFYAAAHDKAVVVRTALTAAVLVGLIGTVLGVIIASPVSHLAFGTVRYTAYFRLVFISFAFSIVLETGLSAFRALNQANLYVTAALGHWFLSMCLNVIFLVWFGLGVVGIFYSMVASSAVTGLAVLCWLTWRHGVGMDGALFGRMLRYSWPLALGSACMLVIHFGDTFFLSRAVTLAEVGLYSLAYKIGMLVAFVEHPISRYWGAQMFDIAHAPGGGRVYARVCTYRTVLLTGAAIALSALSPLVLEVLTTPAYYGAARYVPFIALSYVIRGLAEHVRGGVLLKGHTRQHLVITAVGTIVCLGGYIFLIPAFRVWGAVLATTVAFCSIGLIGYWRAQKIHRFEYELRRLAVLLVIACAYCTMLTMIRPGSRLLQAALAGVMIASYPLVLYAARFWDESEREVLRRTERLVWARLRQLITREHTQQLSAEAKLRGEAQ